MKNLLVLVGLFVLTASCDSLLDLTPNEQIAEDVALSTEQNVLATLTGAYDGLSGAGMLGGNLYVATELMGSDENEFQFNGTFEEYRQFSRRTLDSGNPAVNGIWGAGYSTINRVNNVLSALTIVSADKRTQVEAEAKFIRGVVMFELVRVFAQPYSAGNVTTNLGIPIVTTPTRSFDGADVARSTVQQVYDQVISDLTAARDGLADENPSGSGFATKAAARAYLTRVYLEQGANQLAIDEATQIINSGSFSLLGTVGAVYLKNSFTTEDVFAIATSAVDGVNNLSTYFSNDIRGDVDVQPGHLALYEAGDARLGLIAGGATTKWDLNAQSIAGNVLVVRYAEVLLNRAEAYLKLGGATNEAAALADYNRIRTRAGLAAWSANTALVDVDNDGVFDIDDLLRERRRELCFEGHLIHDLKRNRKTVPVPVVGSVPYTDSKLVFPIPLREMDVNANLVQNADY